MSRVYNFSAGPAVLPEEVLREAADEMLDYRGTGMSVMEMSHRSKAYQTIIDEAEADLRTLMGIPDNYKVLFMQGGASQQFAMIPMNFMKNKVADYIITGQWAKKAWQEAKLFGQANAVASSADKTFTYIPDCSDLPISENADYVYICENNTIYGTKFWQLPNTKGKDLVSDVSSCFLSEPVDVTKYGMIYGGVQKNIGPAGVVIGIIREDLIREDVLPGPHQAALQDPCGQRLHVQHPARLRHLHLRQGVQVAAAQRRPDGDEGLQRKEGRHSLRLPGCQPLLPRHRGEEGSLSHERALRHRRPGSGRQVRQGRSGSWLCEPEGTPDGGRYAGQHLQRHAHRGREAAGWLHGEVRENGVKEGRIDMYQIHYLNKIPSRARLCGQRTLPSMTI